MGYRGNVPLWPVSLGFAFSITVDQDRRVETSLLALVRLQFPDQRQHLVDDTIELTELISRCHANRDFLGAEWGEFGRLFGALLWRAGRCPTSDPLSWMIAAVAGVKKLFGFRQRLVLVLVDVDVVVQVKDDGLGIAVVVRSALPDTGKLFREYINLANGRFPAIGIFGNALERTIDELGTAECITGDPDGRVRLGDGFGLDRDLVALKFLSLERARTQPVICRPL